MGYKTDDPALYVSLALRRVGRAQLKNLTSKNTLEKDVAVAAVAEEVSNALRTHFEMAFKKTPVAGPSATTGMTRKDWGWGDEIDAKAEN